MDAGAAHEVVDVAGLYVTPGLIDIHVHVYPHRGPHRPAWQLSVMPDAHSFRASVTTFVDAGIARADHFVDFKSRWIDTAKTRVLAAGSRGDAEQDPGQFHPRKTVAVAVRVVRAKCARRSASPEPQARRLASTRSACRSILPGPARGKASTTKIRRGWA